MSTVIQSHAGAPHGVVLLAAYNGLRWLPQQLDSILAQQGVRLTVYISVDASTDGTEAWCDIRAMEDPRVQVLPHGGRFGGAAPNFFRLLRDVPLLDFDFVCFADQDDIWLPGKLQRAIQQMQTHACAAYSGNVLAFWPDGRQLLIDKAQPQRQWDYLFEAAGPGCTYVFQRALGLAIQQHIKSHWDAVQKIGLHDWFFYAFARARGWAWVIDSEPGLLYRQHDHNEVGVNAGWGGFLRRARKILSGWGMAQTQLFVQLLDLRNDAFVKATLFSGRMGWLKLLMQTGQCRRRRRDRFYFALVCLALVLAGATSA